MEKEELKSKNVWFEQTKCTICNGESNWGEIVVLRDRHGQYMHFCPNCYREFRRFNNDQ